MDSSSRPVSSRLYGNSITVEVIVAKRVTEITLGIDVSKEELVICDWDTGTETRLVNQATDIRAWLQGLHGPVRLAVEPTSNYHLELVEQAHAHGGTVYLVNARQLAHYRLAVGERNKTDPSDAVLLARYLAHEAESLRPFQPLDARAQQLWALIKRRGVAVETKKQLTQSFRDIGLPAKALFRELRAVIARLEQRIRVLVRALGWQTDYRCCMSIPGVGPVIAAALTAVFHRGAFASADAFIAFIGMDVRVRESGKFRGQRKLSKCGEAEIRRLLYCAAKPSRHYPPFAGYHQQQLDNGLSKIAANVVLARKIARIAFTLMSRQQSFKKQEITYCASP